MPIIRRKFILVILMSVVGAMGNEKHSVSPFAADEVPWLVLIAKFRDFSLSNGK